MDDLDLWFDPGGKLFCRLRDNCPEIRNPLISFQDSLHVRVMKMPSQPYAPTPHLVFTNAYDVDSPRLSTAESQLSRRPQVF